MRKRSEWQILKAISSKTRKMNILHGEILALTDELIYNRRKKKEKIFVKGES